jgi:phosphate/sulfate permease
MRKIIILKDSFSLNEASIKGTIRNCLTANVPKELAREELRKHGLLKGYVGPIVLSFLLSPLFGGIWAAVRNVHNRRAISEKEMDIRNAILANPKAKAIAEEIAREAEKEQPSKDTLANLKAKLKTILKETSAISESFDPDLSVAILHEQFIAAQNDLLLD